jgi:hypothetical protein
MGDEAKKKGVDNGIIFTAMAQEASGLYDIVIKVASAFLGGTLVFLEKIVPSPSEWCIAVLGIGCGLLILTIVFVVIVRLVNIQAGHHALGDEMEIARSYDRFGQPLTVAALISFALGLGLIAYAGISNVPIDNSPHMEKHMQNEEPKKDGMEKKGSLPFGNTKPEPKPAEPKADTKQGS